MFTGLVETVGRVALVTPGRGSKRIAIRTDWPTGTLADGDSVAVDGVCLTVAARQRDRFYADVVAETLERTTLGRLRPGTGVNLERSLRLGDRLGGHLVSGHVDGTVEVLAVARRGDDCRMSLRLAPALAPYVAHKGSVALQGVSLTVASRHASRFAVALVPHTLQHTTLGAVRPGDRLNLEVDLVARYLENLVRGRDAADR